MGDAKITAALFSRCHTLTKQTFVFLPAIALIGTNLLAWPAIAQGNEKAELTAIEQKLFMKSYEQDSIDNRVSRVEKQIFGDATTGDLNERLQRIIQAVGPHENPDGTMSGIKKPQPPPQAPAQQQSQAGPAATPHEDQQDDMQRAQVAVQAAREETINKLLDQGVQLWRAKRGPQATEKFEEVLRLDPHNSQANFSMGIIFESSGNFIEALSCYKRAAQDSPGNRDYQDAVTAIERKAASKQNTSDKQGQVRSLAEDAKAAYDRGEYFSALSFYKELDEKLPNQALIKYNIGTCYFATKNPISALDYYKQALKLKPNEARYATAVQQLETNLTRAQQERMQAEQAWSNTNPQGGGQQIGQQKGHKPKKEQQNFVAPPVAPQGNTDIMSSLGIIAKSGHDGVAISTIGIASRAAHAGLQKGDVIKAVDGTVVKSTDDINQVLSNKQPSSPVQMTIQRGKTMGQVSL